MMASQPEELFVEFLRQRGFNITGTRRKIVRKVFSMHGHFDASELWEALRDEKVSIATVYRTLDLLERAGLVRRVSLGEAHAHYEHVLGRNDHGHLVCSRCGKVIEFDSMRIRTLMSQIADENGFELRAATIQGFGLCRACRG
ncbi:transcriptional repressor [Candidatus Bipolaricaulota bacterium]|nr:transcriptional repressor [Candidatus Bipolaricaulota bacterium]